MKKNTVDIDKGKGFLDQLHGWCYNCMNPGCDYRFVMDDFKFCPYCGYEINWITKP